MNKEIQTGRPVDVIIDGKFCWTGRCDWIMVDEGTVAVREGERVDYVPAHCVFPAGSQQ